MKMNEVYCRPWQIPPRLDKPLFSNTRLPLIGELVRVKVNDIGNATVISHTLVRGEKEGTPCTYAGLIVRPLNPPDWFVRQNSIGTCIVFGAEILLGEQET